MDHTSPWEKGLNVISELGIIAIYQYLCFEVFPAELLTKWNQRQPGNQGRPEKVKVLGNAGLISEMLEYENVVYDKTSLYKSSFYLSNHFFQLHPI